MFNFTFYHPSGNPLDKSSSSVSGIWSRPEGRKRGKSKITFSLFLCMKNVISQYEIIVVGPPGESRFAIIVRKSVLLSQVL